MLLRDEPVQVRAYYLIPLFEEGPQILRDIDYSKRIVSRLFKIHGEVEPPRLDGTINIILQYEIILKRLLPNNSEEIAGLIIGPENRVE